MNPLGRNSTEHPSGHWIFNLLVKKRAALITFTCHKIMLEHQAKAKKSGEFLKGITYGLF